MEVHLRGTPSHITEYTNMGSRSLENEGPRMITGAETSTASIVTNSICLTQLCILTSNKNILVDPTDKSSLFQRVAAVEEDPRKHPAAPHTV
jgi:hypothetical protein